MDRRSKNPVSFIIRTFLIVFIAFGSCELFGMEAIGLAEEAAGALERAGLKGTELFTVAEKSIIEKFGNLTSTEFENLGSELKSTLKNEIEQIANKINADLVFEKEIPISGLKANIDQIIKEGKESFFKNAARTNLEGFDAFQANSLDKIGDVPQTLSDLYGKTDEFVVKAQNVGVKPDSALPKESVETTKANIAHDTVRVAEEDLQGFLKNPGEISVEKFKSQVDSYRATIKEAKNGYAKSSEAEVNSVKKAAEDARLKTISAKEDLAVAKKSGQGVKDAKLEYAGAKGEIKNAEKAAKEVKYKQAKQEYDQAKATRDTAKKELNTTKKVFKDSEGEIADAKKAFDEAEASFKEANKKWDETWSPFGKQGWTKDYVATRLKTAVEPITSKIPEWPEMPDDAMSAVKAGGKNAWKGTKWSLEKAGGGVKWTAEKGWGGIKYVSELLGQALVFMVPQFAMDAINAWAQRKAMLDTIKSVQSFGDILMKLPDSLINEAEPSQSEFVYVGIPTKDQQLTKDFLQTANYYVDKPEYGEPGHYAITDPNAPHRMLALDSGFDFGGEGVAFDESKPTVPLIIAADKSSSSEKSLETYLTDLEGSIAQSPKGETYQLFGMHATGYAGDPTIAALFKKAESSKESFPPLLQRTLNALQSGTKFDDFIVQGFRGLGPDSKNQVDKIDKALWELIKRDSSGAPAPNEPYVGYGIYIYQTKDTPFIKNVIASASHDNVDQQLAAESLADYVVTLDENNKVVPLQTPQAQPPANFASYVFNGDIHYMVSLVSLTKYPVAVAGSKELPSSFDGGISDILNSEAFKNVNQDKLKAVEKQIMQMKSFIDEEAQYGPFTIGSVTMTITKDLINREIYIYKVPNYLGTGIDDYVIALFPKKGGGAEIGKLPGAPINFVSLVTSRIYDGSFIPSKVKLSFSVIRQSGATSGQVTTSNTDAIREKFPGTEVTCKSADRAPLYTLFVEGALNPTKCNGGVLPNPADWALNQYSLPSQSEKPESIKEYLTANDSELLKAITAAHIAWRAAYEKANPEIITSLMGPFRFTPANVLQDVQLTPFNEAAIMNQNFVYVSPDSYPNEYLVMAKDPQGSEVGMPFTGQPYAVSLSTGYVYSAAAQGEAGKVPGERVGQAPLQIDTILAKAQKEKSYSPELLAAIGHSEKMYNARMIGKLHGSFGPFNFYLAKEDYLLGQYIYGDVSSLGKPIDEAGEGIQSVVSQIADYFVVVKRTASNESCLSGCPPVMVGNEQAKDDKGLPLYWHYEFGGNLSDGDAYAVASLVSGASYDRNSTYLGSYDQFLVGTVKSPGITDIGGFTTRTLNDIAVRSGQHVRLEPTINKLVQGLIDRIKAEEKELADAQEEYNVARNLPLDNNIKKELDALNSDGTSVVPYIDNPNLSPRFLKFYNGKYYTVTPGYISSPRVDAKGKPIEVTAYTPGPDRTYTAYSLEVTGKQGTNLGANMGMVYNSDGIPQLFLAPDKAWQEVVDPVTKVKTRKKVINGPGWALQVARAYAGVNVDKNGKQTRVIGITTPSVAFGDTPGSINFLKPTGFDPIANKNNSFDFWYHTKIDSYFVQVTINATKKTYYINLTSGYALNSDGKPRWFESPVYTTKDSGDKLFIGTDQFDILKVALYKAKTKEFAYYTMVGNFAAQISEATAQMTKEKFNARGTFCSMVNDEDPDSKIQLFQATKDLQGNPLAQSFYLVWDIPYVATPEETEKKPEDTSKPSTPASTASVFLGQFLRDEKQAYSLLLYAQTRNKGEPIEKGQFIEDDNFIDPTAAVKKPKTTGIVFDSNYKITAIIYQNQLCPLQGGAITVTNSDGTSRKVGVTQSKKTLLSPVPGSQSSGIEAQWLSFEDGGKIYDYEYDVYLLNPQPESTTSAEAAQHLNLYNLKHGNPSDLKQGNYSTGGFGLNVTTFVPALKHTGVKKAGTKEAMSANALASLLSPDTSAKDEPVDFPPSLQEGFKAAAKDNLAYIFYDDRGSLFINNVVSGQTKRYVYKLGQAQDVNKIYAAPGLDGWYVDLSNGILYDTDYFPSGISLTAPQLYTLLDTISLSVIYDKDGNPKLAYRTKDVIEQQSELLSLKRPGTKATVKPMLRAQMRSGKNSPKALRSPLPSKMLKRSAKATQGEWIMPSPLPVRPQSKSAMVSGKPVSKSIQAAQPLQSPQPAKVTKPAARTSMLRKPLLKK